MDNIPKDRRFLQDGDPIAKLAFTEVASEFIKVPARSPDLNPIENLFNNVRKQLHQDAIQMNMKLFCVLCKENSVSFLLYM